MKHSDCGTTIHVTLDAVGATARIVVLVELHGGRVEASSPGVGHGACFTVLLPTPP